MAQSYMEIGSYNMNGSSQLERSKKVRRSGLTVLRQVDNEAKNWCYIFIWISRGYSSTNVRVYFSWKLDHLQHFFLACCSSCSIFFPIIIGFCGFWTGLPFSLSWEYISNLAAVYPWWLSWKHCQRWSLSRPMSTNKKACFDGQTQWPLLGARTATSPGRICYLNTCLRTWLSLKVPIRMHTIPSCALSFSSRIHFEIFSYVDRRLKSKTNKAPEAPL